MSSGNLELFKMMRERLPESEFRLRDDLMEVAAEFHQVEALVWFFRDATIFERELLGSSRWSGSLRIRWCSHSRTVSDIGGI
jgi:hypothetical protein